MINYYHHHQLMQKTPTTWICYWLEESLSFRIDSQRSVHRLCITSDQLLWHFHGPSNGPELILLGFQFWQKILLLVSFIQRRNIYVWWPEKGNELSLFNAISQQRLPSLSKKLARQKAQSVAKNTHYVLHYTCFGDYWSVPCHWRHDTRSSIERLDWLTERVVW